MSWKTCLRLYTNQIAFLLLSLSEFIPLAININTSYMAKNTRSRNGCSSYIYFQTSGIYTSSLRIIVPRKVLLAKIWGLMPLNTSFMIKLGLKVVIIAKIIYSVNVKMCPFICNTQIHTHIYILKSINCVMSLARYDRTLTAQKKGYFGGRVHLTSVLLPGFPPLWL